MIISSARRLFLSAHPPTRAFSSLLSSSSRSPLLRRDCRPTSQQRYFETEREYHPVADETLDTIQDALDEFCEHLDTAEVSLASGVLTIQLPPHGTWVINKQTPNRQLWWSSPMSGPKRFEYDRGYWYATKDGLNLGSSLIEELHHVYPNVPKLELRV